MSTTDRPHTAVISVQLEVHSLLDTGECSGKTVREDVLKEEYDIDSAFIACVTGSTMKDCLEKLQQKISEFKK